jgi:two-component system response regulator ChvI
MKTGLWSARKRWMVVDDTPAVLEAVAMLLESLDCAEVLRFNSAAEALEAYRAESNAFELVVTDLNMPAMDGAEFCRALLDITPIQAVVLATGSSEISEPEAQALGFAGLLRKPFPARVLIQKLEGLGILEIRDSETITSFFAAAASLSTFSPAWA